MYQCIVAGQGNPTSGTKKAIAVMLEKHGIACDLLHGFDWSKWTTGTPAERLALILAGQEHILEQEDGKKRFVQVVTELSRAFALCAASDEATEIRDDVSFFQALQAALNKQSGGSRKSPEQIDAAVRQLVSKAITTEGQVIDVFTAAGLPKPDIGILSDQFLAEVRGLKHKNVAAELLEKLLKDELKVRSKRNLVQSQLLAQAFPCLRALPIATRCLSRSLPSGSAHREAQKDPQRLPQPLHRHAGGDRGTHQAREGNGRRHQARRGPRPDRRRSRVLRRPRGGPDPPLPPRDARAVREPAAFHRQRRHRLFLRGELEHGPQKYSLWKLLEPQMTQMGADE